MQGSKLKMLLVGAGIAGLVGTGLTFAPAQAAPVSAATVVAPPAVTGKQAKAPFKAGTRLAKQTASKGATKFVKVNLQGKKLSGFQAAAGNVTNVDFAPQLNYCSGGLTYTPVKNVSGVTKYYQVVLYNGASNRTFYSSVANGSTAYPYFYGVTGATTAYLYVWNGSSYVYDEYLSGANNCSVSRSFTTASGYAGYVKYTFTNSGNAYTSVESNELWPYAAYGTYTGQHWDYPAAGGGTVVRYYWVGTGNPYRLYDTSAALYPYVSARVGSL